MWKYFCNVKPKTSKHNKFFWGHKNGYKSRVECICLCLFVCVGENECKLSDRDPIIYKRPWLAFSVHFRFLCGAIKFDRTGSILTEYIILCWKSFNCYFFNVSPSDVGHYLPLSMVYTSVSIYALNCYVYMVNTYPG